MFEMLLEIQTTANNIALFTKCMTSQITLHISAHQFQSHHIQ